MQLNSHCPSLCVFVFIYLFIYVSRGGGGKWQGVLPCYLPLKGPSPLRWGCAECWLSALLPHTLHIWAAARSSPTWCVTQCCFCPKLCLTTVLRLLMWNLLCLCPVQTRLKRARLIDYILINRNIMFINITNNFFFMSWKSCTQSKHPRIIRVLEKPFRGSVLAQKFASFTKVVFAQSSLRILPKWKNELRLTSKWHRFSGMPPYSLYNLIVQSSIKFKSSLKLSKLFLQVHKCTFFISSFFLNNLAKNALIQVRLCDQNKHINWLNSLQIHSFDLNQCNSSKSLVKLTALRTFSFLRQSWCEMWTPQTVGWRKNSFWIW